MEHFVKRCETGAPASEPRLPESALPASRIPERAHRASQATFLEVPCPTRLQPAKRAGRQSPHCAGGQATVTSVVTVAPRRGAGKLSAGHLHAASIRCPGRGRLLSGHQCTWASQRIPDWLLPQGQAPRFPCHFASRVTSRSLLEKPHHYPHLTDEEIKVPET